MNGSVRDSFTPLDHSTLKTNDIDLGSSGVTILPDSLGSAFHPHHPRDRQNRNPLLARSGQSGSLTQRVTKIYKK